MITCTLYLPHQVHVNQMNCVNIRNSLLCFWLYSTVSADIQLHLQRESQSQSELQFSRFRLAQLLTHTHTFWPYLSWSAERMRESEAEERQTGRAQQRIQSKWKERDRSLITLTLVHLFLKIFKSIFNRNAAGTKKRSRKHPRVCVFIFIFTGFRPEKTWITSTRSVI